MSTISSVTKSTAGAKAAPLPRLNSGLLQSKPAPVKLSDIQSRKARLGEIAAAEAYHAAFKDRMPSLGSLIPAEVSGGKRVVHMVAQDDIGTHKRQLDYEAFFVCLEQIERLLREAAAEGRNWVLGLPHGIGCGYAGGAFPIVESMIHHVFANSPVKCVIVQRSAKLASLNAVSALAP